MSTGDKIPVDEALVFGTLVGLAGWCAWEYWAPGYYIDQTIWVCQISGYSSLGFLALSLLFGPVLRVGSWLNVRVGFAASARFARNTGIAAGLAALLHTVIVLTTYLEDNWYAVLNWPYLQSGGLALAIMVLLLIGSIKQLMSLARWQLWKPFFRLSSIAALFVLHHMLYSPFASRRWTIGLYSAALVIWLLRFLPVRASIDSPPVATPEVAAKSVT